MSFDEIMGARKADALEGRKATKPPAGQTDMAGNGSDNPTARQTSRRHDTAGHINVSTIVRQMIPVAGDYCQKPPVYQLMDLIVVRYRDLPQTHPRSILNLWKQDYEIYER